MKKTILLIVAVCVGFCAWTSKGFQSPAYAQAECTGFCGTPEPAPGGGGEIPPELIGGCGGTVNY